MTFNFTYFSWKWKNRKKTRMIPDL
jgi:hypothetical protein